MKTQSSLTQYIVEQRKKKEILLMTHIVLGYPSFEASIQVVDAMVKAGVDLIELQIPFSEPMADGPVILHANQKALAAGATVARCFEVAELLAKRHAQIPLLWMSYFNIVYKRGVKKFAADTRAAGLRGAIIPDVPHEEGEELFSSMKSEGLEPVLLFSPNTSEARMKEIASHAQGLVYCIARKGVTGAKTDFEGLHNYLQRCKKATNLPLAVGFGVQDANDVRALVNIADIAVVGSQTIKVIEQEGVQAVGSFISGLRA